MPKLRSICVYSTALEIALEQNLVRMKRRTSNRTKRPHIHHGIDHDILAIRAVSKNISGDVQILSAIDAA